MWGQVTYQYYAIHNKDNGYLKQVNGGIAVDKTFRYENSHDGNGSSIWVLSSDGYLQQEMYYLNVANDQTLYLSTEKVTQWTIDNTTASGKNYLKPSGSSKFLCADSGPQLKESPSKYLNACEMTITENGNKWEGPKDVSFTVQSPQIVTYLRTYYVRSIIATITKDDADKTNQKVVDKKDSRCYCSLTYSTTTDANKGTKWDINETSGVIYSKQASGDYSVAATYSVAPLDPIALSLHPAADKTVTLKLQPSPLAPDAGKNYLLFNTKEANYRFPYDDGSLKVNDAVKTNASRSVLTEPATSPNNEISWKIVRDDEGFYSFRNVNSGRWLRFDGGQFVDGSDYGVIEVGADGDATPAGNEYKFRLYKSGTYKNTNTAPTYCILPYSKQYAVFKSDGVAANASVALSVYTTPKVISLNKANDDSKYCIFAYEAENRVYGNFTLSGPSSALATGDYVFKTTGSYSSRNIVGSPSNVQDLEIKDSYSVADLSFTWQVKGLDGYITKQTPTVSSGKGTQVVTVNSLPSGIRYGKVRVQAKGGTKDSGWKELEFNLYGEPSYTDISSLSEITSSDGYYRLTADVSDAPGVTEFSGFLDGNMHKISSVSAPLFTTLTGTVKNLVLEDVSISSGDASGNTGAIACTANGAARIYNVGILSGSVGGSGNTGGLVGYLDGTARVINCYSYADITGGTTVGGIVGYNNVATTATNLKTMVMNCMFYGNITGGDTKSPVYGGKNINNNQGGLNTFNYYSYEKLTGGVTDNQYNCALAVEDKYLNRFEFYRLLLNSNKKLAAYYATGSAENGDKMAKWVLETADRTIDNPKPYPVLKAQGYYPSIVNPDIEHAPDSASVGRNHGGKLGDKTLSVTINLGSGAPTDASITTGSLTLTRTDKDFDRFNFNYDKVQLPYYNDVGTGNYTDYKVVTGWKITAITAVEGDPYTSANYPTTGITDFPNHNYADRKSSNKDLYSVSKRVFSQGAYFDVPYGVTSITIEPYWGTAVYVADQYYDVVYKNDYTGKQGVSQVGTQAVDNTTEFNGQKVRTSITGLGSGTTVYDNAVVLVGNFHLDGVPSGGTVPFTMMSVDMDNDHEPDYSLIYHHKNRTAICPIRFDFLNIPGTAQAQKPNGASLICNFTIFKTKGWFEVTNTSSFYTSQLEYENLADVTKTDAPLILLGGVIDQFVSTQSSKVDGHTIYIHVGGNVWINSFGLGTHSDGSQSTPHVPVSVTGGEYEGLYLTGTYNAGAAVRTDNAECYISGGHIVEAAGASLEQINGSVHWQIYNADIDEFFGGGTNDAKPIKGDITTDIYNSNVGLFCGGPKFGNMQADKKVTTNAEGCIFGKYFGAGYGGTSLSRKKYYDTTTTDWPGWAGKYVDDRGKYFDGSTTNAPGDSKYGKKGPGVATDMDYEFFVWSPGNTGGRFFVKYATFSLAQCNDVSSTLKKCTVKTNFYGGGNLGKVVGTATSVLEDCTVNGSVYGAGYSASLPTVEVRDGGFVNNPNYNKQSGMFEPAELSGTTTFTWQNAAAAGKTLTNGQSGSDLSNHILYTNTVLTGLGEVAKSVLTINGTTTVAHSVYGGGEESGVAGNTEVTVTGGTIGTPNLGGAEYGNVYGGGKGKADDVTAGIVKGSTTVSISGSPTILHNVYGGGAYGSVGTFSYDATTGFPTGWNTTDDKGKCTVSITGGTIGTTGDNNGMVFGSSRGLEGDPSIPNVDKMAWVYDTEVTIGTQNAQSNATPWIKGSVYGGGENGHNFHDASVTVHSGTIGIAEGAEIIDDRGTPGDTSDDISYSGARFPNRGNVYGSGCGTDTYTGTDSKTYFDFNAGIVRGNTTVLIDGGHVVHNVYGGGAMGSVGTYTFADAAYHTAHPEVPVGKPISCADGTGTCTVTVSGGQIGVTGATMAEHGKGGPDDYGHVFGAGRGEMHDPDQYPNVETCAFFNKAILNISGTAFLTGSAYGGSESGHVLGDTEINISGGQIGCGKNATKPFPDAVWADDYTPTGESMDCASWPFIAPFAPYDPFANATGDLDKYPNGKSTDGGRLEASDGHTYYGNVFGGGSGSVPYFDTTDGISKYLSTAGSVEGKTTINITGGHIITNVYGGCEATNVKGSATITMTGGTVGVPRTVAQIMAHPNTGYIFGAGKGDQRIFFNKETNVDRTLVNIEGGRVYGSIFGGGEDGHVFQNAIVNIGKADTEGPTIGTWGTSYVDGNVFGGGRGFGGEALTAGNIGGSIELNIKSGKILGSVYGGGRLGSVGYGLYLVDEEITEDEQTIKPYGILRPNDKYDGSYPNPSTQDASAYYDKGRGYITINISGGTIGNDYEYIYNPTDEQKAAIPNTTFDYQNHLQYTKGGNVFTGGMGRLYALDNTTLLPLWPKLGKCKSTTLNMTGGTVKSSIYGGGEIGAVAENATVNVNGGTVGTKVVDSEDANKYYYFGSVFGGGKGSTAKVEGISEAGTTGGNVQVNLNETHKENGDAKGAVVSQVFGCNDMNGSPKGTVTVHVYATQNADKANISAKPEKGTDTYDVQAVYGGGNLAAYEPTDLGTGKTNVIIDGCGLTSVRQVYGGGNAASTPATNVEVNGTYEIEELFGGGNGFDKLPDGKPNPGANVGYKNYTVYEKVAEEWVAKDDPAYDTKEERTAPGSAITYGTGQASVNVFGGTVHRVFGGSNTKGNVRQTAVTLLDENSGCSFCVDEAYGGGKSAPMDAEAKLHMACIPGLQAAYGGAEAAAIKGNVTLNITNGTFDRVFGGNNLSGTIDGSITVNIQEVGCRPIKIGELYGGGNQAGYSVYGYNDDDTPKETGTKLYDDPQVNVMSFTSIGKVFGGGFGSGATMVGNPTVNVNEVYGKWYNDNTSVVGEDEETPNHYPIPSHAKGKMGAIHTVFGGGNAAKVMGNTTVNIATQAEVYIVKEVTAGEALPAGCYTRSGAGTTESPFIYTDAEGTAADGTTYYEKQDVLGADIRGDVYGGGNNAEVTGDAKVKIGKKNE
ncbi:hypothetical protein PRLR5107_30640 [Prevotella lacticifex]|uniref:Peptidase M26 N-terminal domain-containing protein n=1 Tax=Prevotella lacticifex TaxID=2854755 RepID=A0A9R1C863_9BACT|nr:hypothetical protein PRLR5003_29510 [Prevotella lacticifex]GJG40864.1 hypothetical protein PRLR5019_28350 [Prevotella lacticifex]GJG43668.1 hypothetical protein PRLR5025_24540 [Prevotella lacticifex]GJG47449.1 hypothetical protein PRLR5027_30440 [Prevotella lacticifex]GJG49899.1 hypothetical protein PRLR5052_23120 [Prevotella lacticifex]